MRAFAFTSILFMIVSMSASANSSFGTKTIKTIYFHDSGQLRILFNESPTHSEDCTSKAIYVLPESNKHFDQMLAGLMAAMYSKSSVSGWVNGCESHSVHTYPKITRLDLLSN